MFNAGFIQFPLLQVFLDLHHSVTFSLTKPLFYLNSHIHEPCVLPFFKLWISVCNILSGGCGHSSLKKQKSDGGKD